MNRIRSFLARYWLFPTVLLVLAVAIMLIRQGNRANDAQARELHIPLVLPGLHSWGDWTQTVYFRQSQHTESILFLIVNAEVQSDEQFRAAMEADNGSVFEWSRPNTISGPLSADKWKTSTGRIFPLTAATTDTRTQPANNERFEYHESDKRLKIGGRPVSMQGKWFGTHSFSRFHVHKGISQRLVLIVSATGLPRRGMFGKVGEGTNEGIGFHEVFRLSDGERVQGPLQLPEYACAAGLWTDDDKFIVYRYNPNRVLIVPIDFK